jgi:hypothetical protein
LRFLDHHRVFRFDGKSTEPRQHPEDRLAGILRDPVGTIPEQVHASTKAVDDKADDLRLLHRRKAGQGAHDLGKDAAMVDVGHQGPPARRHRPPCAGRDRPIYGKRQW